MCILFLRCHKIGFTLQVRGLVVPGSNPMYKQFLAKLASVDLTATLALLTPSSICEGSTNNNTNEMEMHSLILRDGTIDISNLSKLRVKFSKSKTIYRQRAKLQSLDPLQ